LARGACQISRLSGRNVGIQLPKLSKQEATNDTFERSTEGKRELSKESVEDS